METEHDILGYLERTRTSISVVFDRRRVQATSSTLVGLEVRRQKYLSHPVAEPAVSCGCVWD